MAKLRRDKLTLEKQSRALLKLPTKKDRSEVLPSKEITQYVMY